MDMGVVIGEYQSDLTRTVPVAGRFSLRQKEIYATLLSIQKMVEREAKPGLTLAQLHTMAEQAMAQAGMEKYFTHYLGHYIGIDGHDVGDINRPLEPGMVFTNEPGIYIPEEGIGFRIEDMLLITPSGCENLTAAAPREMDEIEKVMAAPARVTIPSPANEIKWRPLSEAFADAGISLVKLHPQNSNIVFVGTYSHGLFKSSDGGKTWQHSDQGIARPKIWALAFDPRDSNHLFVGTHREDAVYQSWDGGESWSPTQGEQLRKRAYVKQIIFDPYDSQTLYLGTLWDGIYKTTDGGKSWSLQREGLGNPEVNVLVINPRDGRSLFAGTCWDGVYKSTNAGKSWNPSGLSYHFIHCLALSPTEPDAVYAGTDRGLYRSPDGGANWTLLSLEYPNVEALAISADGALLLAGTYQDGLFVSRDGGNTWQSITDNLPDRNIQAVALDEADGRILIGTFGHGAFVAEIELSPKR